ncbi:hypothetical protein, variant [Aphanomyces astaci]|uniref:Uncharacterized protein n=1 Tax=Aphanomyces astaci TaxID=112090 RepID=W4G9A1_APHAT|nr:hypothetical protein, variant [Aphanomyces astaci]ETV75609.1 hypothetical protein, variant [Aphanomyces astaci]|eukprot:XP_009834740.1 hypothetical protein, variant [Aphanomyces astaci]
MASSTHLPKAPTSKIHEFESDKENFPPCTKVGATKDSTRLIASKPDKVSTPCNLKGSWSIEDDVKMRSLVYEYGTKNWNEIASHFTHKSGRQCHERWKQMGSTTMLETPKKAASGYAGNFDFTKALAVIKKNVASGSAVKSTPTPSSSQPFRGRNQFPGILGKATPPHPLSSHAPYSASPRLGKVNKLHSIANKLKIRQELLSAEKVVTPKHHKNQRPMSPVHATPQKQRNKAMLGPWSTLYGVDADDIECVTFIKRPPPPPPGYMPRRVVPELKRRRQGHELNSQMSTGNVPWMHWSGEALERSLIEMIAWRYDQPPSSQLGQFAAVNRAIKKRRRSSPTTTAS